jgi:hypothetical protein
MNLFRSFESSMIIQNTTFGMINMFGTRTYTVCQESQERGPPHWKTYGLHNWEIKWYVRSIHWLLDVPNFKMLPSAQ